jgi:6,7-dimethyl-8-ribityllumazine synthase
MLKSFHVGRYLDPADFDKLTQFLEAIGFVRTPGKENEENGLGFRSAAFSAPPAIFWIGVLEPGLPNGMAIENVSMLVGLQASDPALIFETARRQRLRVLGPDTAVEASPDGPFSIKMGGGIIVSVSAKREQPSALEGTLQAAGRCFGIVVARFNSFITERLLESAQDGLLRCGAKREDIQVVRVPGAFEIPSAARTLALTGKYDAIICLGCLLRGGTAHYDVIVNEVTRGIGQSAQETGVPHAFGVLTCDTLEQAIDRAGLKMGNKGFEAALAAVEMASLKHAISHQPSAVRKKQIPLPARGDKGKKQQKRTKSKRA